MFWGNGDSSRLEDQEAKTLKDLRRMVETGHIVALTADQSKVALRAIDWYQSWEGTFKVLSSIRNTAILLGFLLTLWVVTEGTIADFVKGVLRAD